MRKLHLLLLAAAAGTVLGGCSRGGLYNRGSPDEFAVQRQTPLVVPPDFALEPPRAGQPRPVETGMQQQALDAMFGGPAPRSAIEADAVSRAGTSVGGIRSTVGDAETASVPKGPITRDILAAPVGDGRDAQTSVEDSVEGS